MHRTVIVIGAGAGGLAAAIRLARHGYRVQICEARDLPGGLAAAIDLEGLRFDSGPYVLLDRPGLEWAFRQLLSARACPAPDPEVGEGLEQHVAMRRIDQVYEVVAGEG